MINHLYRSLPALSDWSVLHLESYGMSGMLHLAIQLMLPLLMPPRLVYYFHMFGHKFCFGPKLGFARFSRF